MVCNEKKSFLVERSMAITLTTQTELSKTVKAPVTAGQQIGVVRVYVDGAEIGTVKIVAERAVKKMTFTEAAKILFKSLFNV